MSSRRRTNKKFWNRVFLSFLLYSIVVPLIYLLLDRQHLINGFKEDPWLVILKITGIALGISLVMNFWGPRDPELRKY